MKFLIGIFLAILVIILPQSAMAAGEFATNYVVSYDVDGSGVTTVSEDITLRNLTDRYFASDFSQTISANQLNDLVASDKQGNLEISQEQVNGKTVVKVKFKQQVVGQDKEYKFNLKFKSPDFAQNQGKVWQITVPKTPNLNEQDQFSLRLAVPVGFGDPASITPEPVSQRESGGKIVFNFNKDQLIQSGVSANFGIEQWLDFKIKYQIKNDGILPAIKQIPIPNNTSYQEVLINQIQPQPENVTIDQDGNYLAWFKVGQRQSLAVEINGQAHLQAKPFNRAVLTDPEQTALTNKAKYWESDNPAIKERVEQLFSQKANQLSVSDKALAIEHFVASFLKFDTVRRAEQNYLRLGGLTVLNNPDTALSSEFSDLFVSMARAAGIPARRLEGYAYSTNSVLRPASLGPNLHSWAEYYDPNAGWVMVDPTWENTTGGADFGSRFDLDHLVLLTLGRNSSLSYDLPTVEVNLSSSEFTPRSEVRLAVDLPNNLISGWPISVQVRGQNIGNVPVPASQFTVSSQHLMIPQNNQSLSAPAVPPFGQFSYQLPIRSGQFWQSETDRLKVSWLGATVEQELKIKPLYENRWILVGLVSFLILTISLYVTALVLHVKILRK